MCAEKYQCHSPSIQHHKFIQFTLTSQKLEIFVFNLTFRGKWHVKINLTRSIVRTKASSIRLLYASDSVFTVIDRSSFILKRTVNLLWPGYRRQQWKQGPDKWNHIMWQLPWVYNKKKLHQLEQVFYTDLISQSQQYLYLLLQVVQGRERGTDEVQQNFIIMYLACL